MKRFMVTFVLLSLIFVGCASTNTYKAYVIADKELTVLAEQYESWYQMADPEQQANWKADIDPLFIEMDKLLDDWQLLLLAGEETDDIVLAINRIKSRILAELMKRLEDK